MTAIQGATNQSLEPGPPAPPNNFGAVRPYDASKLGAWTITAVNGPHSAVSTTNNITVILMLPFVNDLTVSGALLTPTVSWQLPTTSVPFTRIRVRVVDFPAGGSLWFNSNPLPTNTTAYALPAGMLRADRDYLIRVMLEDVRNGKLVNRSETRVAYTTFTAPVTIIDGPFYLRRALRNLGDPTDRDQILLEAFVAPSTNTYVTARSLIDSSEFTLGFVGGGAFPYDFYTILPFSSIPEAVATGGFTIIAEHGTEQDEVIAQDIAGVQPIPFVDNLETNVNESPKARLTPTLTWDLPSTAATFTQISVRIISAGESFIVSSFSSPALPTTANTYTVPSGVLTPDIENYFIWVRLNEVSAGRVINRSETRMPYSTVATYGQLGVKRGNTWYMDLNTNSKWDGCLVEWCVSWGQPSDTPLSGDWNGNGVAEIGVKRGNLWYLDNGNDEWDGCGAFPAKDRCLGPFGMPSDQPVAGNWNGSVNGVAKIGVKRRNRWYLDVNGNGRWDNASDETLVFGLAGDRPVVGDWGNNGVTDIGVRSGNRWYLDNGNGQWDGCGNLPAKDICSQPFGLAGDQPVVGDWNGDGADEVGVKRGNQWLLDLNRNYRWDGCTVDLCLTWGAPGDVPLIGRWTP